MNGWVPFFIALHIATAVAIAVLMGDYHFVDPALMNDINASANSDSINLANQLGRLDVLTLSISVLSVVIAVATILGFWFYRGVVDQRATDEVRERLPMVLDDFVKRNPYLFSDAVRANAAILSGLAGDSEITDFSDDIAKAMEGEPE